MRIILVLINMIFGKEELGIEEKIMEDLIQKMDKNVRPYEDILPLRVKMNVFVTSIDSIKETTMDFGLTFILR
jgi:hypothetical protein